MVKIKLNKTLRNVIIAVIAIIALFALSSLLPDKGFSEKYEGVDLTSNSGTNSSQKSYSDYSRKFEKASFPKSSVIVNVLDYDEVKSNGTHVEKNYHGKDVVITDDESSVTWAFDVPEEGNYNIQIEYIAVPSRNISMERMLYINGEIPFEGADNLVFYRLWKDGGPIKSDNRGNNIRPSQVEFYEYQKALFKSDLGYEIDPYVFHFNKGQNTITLESTNEPMAISNISLVPVKEYDTYEKYVAKQPLKPENFTSKNISVLVQGEESIARSDASLFARADRSSPTTKPYSVKNSILNYTGGDSWKSPGQWIEWEFEVPEDGWYTITIKGRQLYQRGYVSCRSVYIDGEIPVDSLKCVNFPYSSDWNMNTIKDSNNQPMKFYLSKGKHRIRLEAILGEVGTVIRNLQDSVFRLNSVYRRILVLTGTNPDQYRDYEIDKVYPDVILQMDLESKRLYALVDEFIKITGQKSNQIAPAETLAAQLEQFCKRPEKITQAFQNFKDNVTSLGSSVLGLSETKLDVDYIVVQSANDKILKDNSNFLKKARHEISSFVASFFTSSESLGNVYKKGSDHLIEVWIVTNRDQSQILKNMVDDSFSPESGINVNVKLIQSDSVLNAVVSGEGPDVILSTYQGQPVDYALRNANVNLMRFPDCEEVLSRFAPSAYECFKYNGGIYALPETESFNLLFYRKDILEELNLEVPETWDDLIEMLPTLQGSNLSVGIPYPNIQSPDVSVYYSMIYQNGGTIYNDKGTRSLIDSEEGIDAFKTYTSFYNNYGLPSYYDFASRFRTGEMALGISNYTTFNTLAVSAPEIRGLWDFTYLPGIRKEDGSIDRSSVPTINCCMIIKKGLTTEDIDPNKADGRTKKSVQKNEERIQDCWTFLKWWVSSDTQVRFGREMEAVLGSSGRHSTANIEGLKQLPWNSKQIKLLIESMNQTVGVPEIPGGYYTSRHVVNSARRVINEKDDARETLIDYTRKINEEIVRKRQEFNLPVE